MGEVWKKPSPAWIEVYHFVYRSKAGLIFDLIYIKSASYPGQGHICMNIVHAVSARIVENALVVAVIVTFDNVSFFLLVTG